MTELIRSLSAMVPDGGMQIIEEQLTRLSSTGRTTLGSALLFSLAIALWSASAGVRNLFEAIVLRDSVGMIAQHYCLYIERKDAGQNMARIYALSIDQPGP